MPIKEQVTLDQVIARLNRELRHNAKALAGIIGHRVPCSAKLARRPAAQVLRLYDGPRLGALGLLNSIFGINDRGCGEIGAVVDAKGKLVRFVRTSRFDGPVNEVSFSGRTAAFDDGLWS